MEGNTLILKGERKGEKEKKEKNFHAAERAYGSFQRMIEFPTEVNAAEAKASLKDGVLELTVPKLEQSTYILIGLEASIFIICALL